MIRSIDQSLTNSVDDSSTIDSKVEKRSQDQVPTNWWPRLRLLFVGHSLYWGFNWLYDYLFFAAMIYWLGPWVGGLVLCVITAGLDFGMLWVYRLSQVDLLGIEYLRSLRAGRGKYWWERGIGWLLGRVPDWLQIVVLTPFSNAFLTTALLRENIPSSARLSRRDLIVFSVSFALSQIYWIAIVSLGVEGIEGLIRVLYAGAGIISCLA